MLVSKKVDDTPYPMRRRRIIGLFSDSSLSDDKKLGKIMDIVLLETPPLPLPLKGGECHAACPLRR
jgi:hypothetical protein